MSGGPKINRLEALVMHEQGRTFTEIARRFRVTRFSAQRFVERNLRRMRENVAEIAARPAPDGFDPEADRRAEAAELTELSIDYAARRGQLERA